jgi:hypothetical protein
MGNAFVCGTSVEAAIEEKMNIHPSSNRFLELE